MNKKNCLLLLLGCIVLSLVLFSSPTMACSFDNHNYGYDVAIDGDFALVGADGTANIFKRSSGKWEQTFQLFADTIPSADQSGSGFGRTVALDGETAIIGASMEPYQNPTNPNFESKGTAYIYQASPQDQSWNKIVRLTPKSISLYSRFGQDVDISGDYAVVGAPYDCECKIEGGQLHEYHHGSIFIFHKDQGTWHEISKKTPPNLLSSTFLGDQVALDGDYLLASAPTMKIQGKDNAGMVWVYHRVGNTWQESARLQASDFAAKQYFGHAVALWGDYALVGSGSGYQDNPTAQFGKVYVFHREGSNWVEMAKLSPSDAVGNQFFGYSLAIAENTVLIGAPGYIYDWDYKSPPVRGAAYIFTLQNGTWAETRKLTGPGTDPYAYFGASVALQTNDALVGAPNKIHTDNPGNVYFFTITQPAPPKPQPTPGPAPTGDHHYYLPGFKSGNGAWTGIGVTNRSQKQASITAEVFSDQGKKLKTESLTLAGEGQKAIPVGLDLKTQGWIKLTSTQPLSGLCFMGGAAMADVPVTNSLAKNLVVPHIAQDSTWDTSLLLCNPNATTSAIKIIYQNGQGQTLATKEYTLPAQGGHTYPLAEIFSGLIPLAGSISIEANPGIAAFALYSNLKSGGHYYAGINAVPH